MVQLAPGFTAHSLAVYVAESGDTSINATITVASNKSKQEMQSYLDAFNKKYPGIEIDYNYYSDYETEVGKQIEAGDYPDVLLCRAPSVQTNTLSILNHLEAGMSLRRSISIWRAVSSSRIRYTAFHHQPM